MRRLTELRRKHPTFHRRNFFQGRGIQSLQEKDIVWLNPDGEEMSESEWKLSFARSLGVFMAGDLLREVDEKGRPLTDNDMVMLFSAHHEVIPFRLPELRPNARWDVLLDTAFPNGRAPAGRFQSGDTYLLQGRSLVLLTRKKQNGARHDGTQ